MLRILFAVTLLIIPLAAYSADPFADLDIPLLEDYLGAEGCKECHLDKYEGWERTFHSSAVQDARKNPDAILGDFDQKGIGFKKEEIDYTIGAHWNQRYMKKIGDDHYILPKSWSISSQRWEPYNVWGWKKMPYSKNCIGCHVTRFDPRDNSFVEHKIGCESCHGPSRKHAETGGEAPSINPAKLGVEMEMICASCHVRGLDNTGEYRFPIGYVPGRDLSKYYTPSKMEEGEEVKQSLLRQFREWWGNAGTDAAECEVCGIPNTSKTKDKPKSKNDYCFSCHKFGDKFPLHTNHDKSIDFDCYDCHKKVSVEIEEDETENVHSISYFLVHKKTCYDKNYSKACIDCHTTWSEDKAKEALSKWRGRESVHD